MSNGMQPQIRRVLSRPTTQRIQVIKVPMRAPAAIDDMIAALEKAKTLGARGGTASWTMQANPLNPNEQILLINEEESAPVEVVG